WQRPEQVSVIPLTLVVAGDRQRRRLQQLFAAMHSIKRALQRDVRKRLHAYWASPRRLQQDAAEWRQQLGLTKEDLERQAYRPPRTLPLAAGPRQQGAGHAHGGRGVGRGRAAPVR